MTALVLIKFVNKFSKMLLPQKNFIDSVISRHPPKLGLFSVTGVYSIYIRNSNVVNGGLVSLSLSENKTQIKYD